MPVTLNLRNSGSRFPFVNLRKAIERAKLLFDADQRGREMSVSAAFGVWGYSDKSSGGFQTVAALKGYGLLKESGGADARKVSLSDEALRYFRDERPEEKFKLLKVFALRPRLILALWNDWGATPPADTIARSHLKTEVGLNDQSARSLLAIYRENISFSELKAKPSEAEILEEIDETSRNDTSPQRDDRFEDRERGNARVGDYIQWESAGVNQFERSRRVRLVSADGQYVAVDGSETGIPMAQVVVEERAPRMKPQPPVFPRGLGELSLDQVSAQAGESEWMRLRLSADTAVRLLVTGEIGPREIGKLIRLLKAQKAVLSDDEEDEGAED